MNRAMRRATNMVALAGVMTMGLSVDAKADFATPIIPREAFFGNPDKASVQISRDGKRISYLAPVDGVLNVWVGPASDPSKAKPVTKDTNRGIRSYFWPHNPGYILYVQDKGGDENWHVYSTDLATNKTLDLTPMDGVQARVQEVSPDFPDEILVAINNRDKRWHDIHRVNIRTGVIKLVQQNDEFAGFLTEDDMKIHFGLKMTPDGGSEIHRITGDNSWTLFTKIPQEDAMTTNPIGLDETGKSLFMIDSRDRNTAALISYGLESGQSRILAKDDKADIAGVFGHPTRNIIQAVQSNYMRRRWQVLDPSIEDDFNYLKTVTDGEFNVTSRTHDDRLWTVAYVVDQGPVRYYLYNRDKKKANFLFTNRKSLESAKLAKMHPVVIKSRDGLNLVSYLTLPVGADSDGNGRPDKAGPMVLFVHGGPWARDSWGYNPYHQWLANRGYAVLSVNYRGSTGFGKNFINASAYEWAGKMHDDLIDAVAWSIKEGIADKDRVGIMGGSYGGYATLVGLTFTPDTFACGVDIVGPSSIVTLLESIPPYWKPIIEMFTKKVGDHRTEEGRKFLLERSPITHVDKIRKPLLIGQGANDPRVKQAEADQIVAAMNKHNIPVTYVLYPDEGHGFRRPPNSMSFNAVTEAFLGEYLGGRVEPMSEDIGDSSITIPSGAELIPGIPAKLIEASKSQS